MYVNIFIGLSIEKYYLKKKKMDCENIFYCIYYFLYGILRKMFIVLLLIY